MKKLLGCTVVMVGCLFALCVSAYSWEGGVESGVTQLAATSDTLYVLGGNGTVYAYKNGAWESTLGSGTQLVATSDAVYVLGGNGTVYTYENGAWVSTVGGGTQLVATLDAVYVLSSNGTVYTYKNGAWESTVGSGTQLLATSDAVYVLSSNGTVYTYKNGAWESTGGGTLGWWNLNNGRNVKDFGAVGNGNTDDTVAIQAAIDAAANSSQLVYFPTGMYRVTSELKVWQGVQLRGDYSRVRPIILLGTNTPGYNNPSNPAYVLKFYETSTERAWSGTFASQIDGINIIMEGGNNSAIGMWFTAAQGSGASNCEIVMNGNLMGIQGLPGISVNENIEFEGGRVGLKLHSGVWPFVLKGCTFNNQTFAAIEGESGGGSGTGVVLEGCYIKNCPIGIYIPEWVWSSERLYLEDCAFENISSGKAIVGSHGGRYNGDWQIVMKNTYFKDVAYISYWEDGSALPIDGYLLGWCRADYVTHGIRWENSVQMDIFVDNHREVTYNPSFTGPVPINPANYVDPLSNKSNCVNVENYGANGNDGLDDTTAIRNAIAANPTTPIWFPIGVYKVTDTILLQKDTKLIGEHCKNTRVDLVLADTSFNNPANPKPIFDTVDDPTGTAIFAHFGFGAYFDNIDTPENEYDGMINIRWRVGRNSMIYDVYSLNGDGFGGTGYRGYACLMITGSGGGRIKQIWAPWNNVSAPGSLYINGTNEPLMLYGMGFEHSMYKPFIYISDANNVTCRSIQAEANAGIIEAHRSHNLVFNNVYYHGSYPDVEPIAMQFYDCSNIEIYCYWRVWTPNYYPTALLYEGSYDHAIPDTGAVGIAAYREKVGIVANWRLDGNVLDTAGNGHNGTIIGNPQYVQGIRGTSLQFDGAGDYVEIPDSTAWDLGSTFTVELWFKTTQSIVQAGLLGQYDDITPGGWFLFTNQGKVYWQYYSAGLWRNNDAYSLGSSMVLNDGIWHYIVVTNNSGICSLYVDGVRNDTAIQLSINSASVPLNIGSLSRYNQDFAGTIDNVVICNTTLSDSEIQSRYGGVLALWRLDGNVLDMSGNDHHATVIGNHQWVQSIRGLGIYLDGVGDYLEIPDSTAWDLGSTFTVELWFKTTQSIIQAGLLGQYDDITPGGWLLFTNQGKVYWQYYSARLWRSNAAHSLSSSMVLNDGIWHYIVVTNNGGVSNLYVDGVRNDTASQLSIDSASVSLTIGSLSIYNQDFAGTIDNVVIRNTTLSDSEIQSRYASGGF